MSEDNGYTREVVLTPAWDRRDPDPNKDYGVHGVDLRMYLKGPKGTIQFVIYTNWMLPGVDAPHPDLCKPMPADVGYHSPVPMYEGDTSMRAMCDLVPGGGPCFYDGSGLRADEWFSELLVGGSDRIWELMEEEYRHCFENVTTGDTS